MASTDTKTTTSQDTKTNASAKSAVSIPESVLKKRKTLEEIQAKKN